MSELWRPSAARVADSNLTRFTACLNARKGLKLGVFEDLCAWSVSQPEEFWTELARFADVRAVWGDGPILENPRSMPGARFFPNARLNFAENLLRRDDEHAAIVFLNERGTRRQISHRQLRAEVARIAAGLRATGVGPGDRVAGYLPNLPETTIAMLATASLGAIWSSCSPDFGAHGVLDRFGQIAPKVLFTADGYFYAGKTFDSLAHDGGHGIEAAKRGAGRRHPVCEHRTAARAPRGGRRPRHALADVWRPWCAAALRLSSIQPSALHPLLLGDDRRLPSASCTGRAEPCCSTRRSTSFTRTSSAATASSTSRPAAG